MRRLLLAIFIGLGLGVSGGLFVGWVVAPVQFVESSMSVLASRHKDEYTVMVAAAYEVDGDLNAALNRLRPLGAPNIPQYVQEVTERYISESGPGKESDIRKLVNLARAMGRFTPPMQPFTIETPIPAPSASAPAANR